MRLVVIGTGYVGLVSGACFADIGHHVVCTDTDARKIAALNEGRIPIHEPGLPEIVAANMQRGTLSFSTDTAAAARSADVVFIAVGTPSRGDGLPELGYLRQAARMLAQDLSSYTVVVIKSTVPVGTADEIERLIADVRPRADFAVVTNPEFLREGSAVRDFMHPDRVIVGVEQRRAKEIMRKVYAPLSLSPSALLFTERRAAELTKYASNAFLATKITFINEIADLCEEVGVDVEQVAHGVGLDHRIGGKFLRAGPGFGGSCFPKDTAALLSIAQDHGVAMRIVEAVVSVNERRKRAMARKVVAALGGDVRGRSVALLGLTFKPNTDDVREAPALALITALQDMGAQVRLHDPVGMEGAKSLLRDVTLCKDPLAAAEGADALVVVTEWDQFRTIEPGALRRVMANPLVIDLRNIYDGEEMHRNGFQYVGVGRAPWPRDLVQRPQAAGARNGVRTKPVARAPRAIRSGDGALVPALAWEPAKQLGQGGG